jgi:hypothetical protein
MDETRPPILDYANPPSVDDDLVPVRDFMSPVEANLAVALLDSEDIPALLSGENASITIGLSANLSRITLLVPRRHLDRAAELLRQAHQPGSRLASGIDSEPSSAVSHREAGRLSRARLAFVLLLASLLLVFIAAIAMMS